MTRALRHCFPVGRRVAVSIQAEGSAKTAQISGRSVHAVREELLLYHMAVPGTAFISGHIPFSGRAFNEFGKDWSFVTVLREPVSRWLSAYYYNRYKTHTRHLKTSASIEEYLESPQGLRAGSAYIRFFSGSPEERPEVDRAIHMMKRFAAIGILEDLNGFRRVFRDRFGTEIRIPHVNRTPAPESAGRHQIPSHVRAKVEEICEPDVILYNSVLANHAADANSL